jgi:mRNA interferase RelE/StbE
VIEALGRDPCPVAAQKLGGNDMYRIRHGDYRVLYQIDDATVVVAVVRVAHRREVSRQ